MSDILSTFLSSESSFNKNKYSKKISTKQNNIFLNNGLRLSKEGNILKLPKLNMNYRFITENNKSKSSVDLEHKSDNNEIILINSQEPENDSIFQNKYLSDMNSNDGKKYKGEKPIKNLNYFRGKIINEQFINNKNKLSKSSNKNKYRQIIFNRENAEMRKERKKEKERMVNEYIDFLLTEGKAKHDKFYEAAKKVQSNKFSLANCINPAKYIQTKILDDSFNYNDFKTSKIQKECFNGNEKFRKANFKNIKINLMNNIFLNSMSANPEETGTNFRIRKMLDEQNHINNLHFGKSIFNRKDEEIITQNKNSNINA
jgi:hypothetical protein